MRIQITVPILKASGVQVFEIDADSIEEAKRMWLDEVDDTVLINEELHVERIGEPVFKEV